MVNKLLIFCFCSITISFANPDTSTSSDVLDDKYNLGRIGDNAIMNAWVLYGREGTILAVDGCHLQNGKKDVFSFGETFLGSLVLGEYGGIILMLPEVDFSAAIGPAHRIGCTMVPSNFFITSLGNGATGFDAPFYMVNAYKWDFLSKQGQIRLSPRQMENSFYFKPLVNRGQLRFTTNILHSIGSSSYANPQFLNLFSTASFGIIENLQITGGFQFENYKWEINNYGWDNYQFWNKRDTIIAVGKLDYRHNSLNLQGGYKFSDFRLDSSSIQSNALYLDAGYLFGNHISSIDQVQGNWDGYFTPFLGAQQTHINARLEYRISDENPSWYFRNETHYGLMNYGTIGERLGITTGKYQKTSYNFHLDAVFMNIPIRTYGPSKASSFEYLFGFLPRKGQLRVDCALRIPIQKQIFGSYETPSLLEYAASESVLGLALSNNYISTEPKSELGWTRPEPLGSKIKNNDFFAKFSAGLSDNCILLNSFELRTDRYLALPYQFGYQNQSSGIQKNTIYSNNLGISFFSLNRRLFTISVTYLGQTDNHISSRNKWDLLFSGLLQATF